jgi:UDP-glucuronate 4-epimerase
LSTKVAECVAFCVCLLYDGVPLFRNAMQKQTILITGVAGFIGTNLALQLLDAGHHVIGIDEIGIFSNGRSSEIDQLRAIRFKALVAHPMFRYLTRDVTKPINMLPFNPTVIIHLAGVSGVSASQNDPHRCVHTNIIGFENVMALVKQLGSQVKQVLYASSSSVYGSRTGAMSETDTIKQTVGIYATSKRSVELLANNYQEMYPSVRITGLRFFSVYGEMGRPDMAPWLFTKNACDGVQSHLYGNWSRDFTHINDITEVIKRLLVCSYLPPILNIGSGRSISGQELAATVLLRCTNHICPPVMLPARAFDMVSTLADTSLLQNVIGRYSFKDFNTGINDFVDWYKWFVEQQVAK